MTGRPSVTYFGIFTMPEVQRPLLLLDLDYTLFNTDRFVQDLAQLVAPAAGIAAPVYRQQIPDYYEHNGMHLAHYRFSQHLGALGLNKGFLEEKITPVMTGRDYTYPDVDASVRAFIRDGYDVRVLTYGEQSYQQLKLRCAGIAGQLAADIILEGKGLYIGRRFPGRAGAIIDDKQITDLPAGVRAIYIDRTGTTAGRSRDLHEARQRLAAMGLV